MSRTIRKQLFSTFDTLIKANQILNRLLTNGKEEEAASLLVECQSCAIAIGTRIEENYGEGTLAVHALEEYCELIYRLSENLNSYVQRGRIYELICEQINVIRQAMEQEIPDRIEMVFLPYKASMWDSLESVYLAAKKDENCDAYVIPIPYYDRNKDGSFGEMHYEGDAYPANIPVVSWQEYDFAKRCPDVVFIHNPYDEYNYVTSVHPFFYSKNLKQYTDTLVYIPYYSTSGGMNDARRQCSAYYYADYIVIQAEKYRKYFDANLPEGKFLALGSPKFDRVIRMCENPPEVPEDWKEKMAGKKVYFYNTSIQGMLNNTPAFLKKMEYVFRCFAERKDTCLLWRPHPLLESSFDSARAAYKPIYEALKKYFLESGMGVYDESADITRSIALSDAYIGDAGSSVVSLFGLAGKPIFILNNAIHTEPEEDDWRGEMIKMPIGNCNRDWMITQGNKLYHAPNHDFKYHYCCDLSEYAGENYYFRVITIEGKNYVCPGNAQDILVVDETGVRDRIELKRLTEQLGAFYGAVKCGHYLFLIPNRYPAIVRYDTIHGDITYFEDYPKVFVGEVQGARAMGGYCAKGDFLYLASPTDNRVLELNAVTGEMQIRTLQTENACGYGHALPDGEDVWLVPYKGSVITRWHPESGAIREYANMPEGLICKHPSLGYEVDERPFGYPIVSGESVYFPPCFGNMYIKLDKQTGEIAEWEPPFERPEQVKNGYYRYAARAHFVPWERASEYRVGRLFSVYDKRLYEINLETKEYTEVNIEMKRSELLQQEAGFCEQSQWLQYACMENAFHSLTDFLDGSITGEAFDKERQIKAYGEIAANHDGTCGEKVYQYLRDRINK